MLLLQGLLRDVHLPRPQAGHRPGQPPAPPAPVMLVWWCRPAEHGDQRGPGAVLGLLPPQPGPGVRPPGSGCRPCSFSAACPAEVAASRRVPCVLCALPRPSARAKPVDGSTWAAPAQSQCICRCFSQHVGTYLIPPLLLPLPCRPAAGCTTTTCPSSPPPSSSRQACPSTSTSPGGRPVRHRRGGPAVVAEAGTGRWLGWVPHWR